MAYIRAKKRKGKSGVQTYYYLVEGQWIDGKVKQKVIKYLGKKPDVLVVELDREQTKKVVEETFLADIPQEELKKRLKRLGIPTPEEPIGEMNLTHKIGGKKCTLSLRKQS
jgi:hypothetical protein